MYVRVKRAKTTYFVVSRVNTLQASHARVSADGVLRPELGFRW